MTTAKKILGAALGEEDSKLYVNDVFSTYLYTGTGSTQMINNGIDLAGKGGMLWLKSRSAGNGHTLRDSVRGPNFALNSNATGAQFDQSSINPTFNNNGFSLQLGENASGGSYVGWTFRRAPKFFDVVTYTGNGVAGRQIPHELGIAPGMILIKALSVSSDWLVWHRGMSSPNNTYMRLNTIGAEAAGTMVYGVNSTVFSLQDQSGTGAPSINQSGVTYVAYLFAHDPSADGIIQCGSFTTDTRGNATVNLGWEPQFGIIKVSNATQDWYMMDSMRGMPVEGSSLGQLFPNTSGAEVIGTQGMHPTATGFVAPGFLASRTYIYLAIRRPNKPVINKGSLFNAIPTPAQGGGESATWFGGAGYDLAIASSQNGAAVWEFVDRLRGLGSGTHTTITKPGRALNSASTAAEFNNSMVGAGTGAGFQQTLQSYPYMSYLFRRAPGFMDVVCYTGTGAAPQTVRHGLGVVPELVILKSRSNTGSWMVVSAQNYNSWLSLDTTAAASTGAEMIGQPTLSSMFIRDGSAMQNNGWTYVAYLFATKEGISKVGSYTGNGTTQTINCGFTTGARFILIKRTDSTGDWYVWDSARGIVAGNDPHLSLNTTAAEVTSDDSVDPAPEGFICNQVAATNINVSGGQYIFLAIA